MAGSVALTADLESLVAYVTAAPRALGGKVLLPGEIERGTNAERSARGIPLDPNTLDQLRGGAGAVGLSDAAIDRAVNPKQTTCPS